MGFFSWNCSDCGLPIMSPYDVPEGLHWMNECVVLGDESDKVRGNYDGYGRVVTKNKATIEITDWFPEFYHDLCYIEGIEYEAPSDRAECQGYFWNMCEYLDEFRGKVPGDIEENCNQKDSYYRDLWGYHEGDDLV